MSSDAYVDEPWVVANSGGSALQRERERVRRPGDDQAVEGPDGGGFDED